MRRLPRHQFPSCSHRSACDTADSRVRAFARGARTDATWTDPQAASGDEEEEEDGGEDGRDAA